MHVKEAYSFPLFKKMIDILRFEHFTPDYVLNVVTYCPFVVAEDHDGEVMRKIMRKAFSRRYAVPALLRKAGLSSSTKYRGAGQEEWTFESMIPFYLVNSLEPGERNTETLGLANGYPVQYKIAHLRDGKVGIYFNVAYPSCGMLLDDRERRGVGMRICFNLHDGPAESMEHYFLEGESYGSPACFGHKTWKEVTDKKNRDLYFPEEDDDEATLSVTYTFLTGEE